MRYGVVVKIAQTDKKVKCMTSVFQSRNDQTAFADVLEDIRYCVVKLDARIYNLDTKRVFPCKNYTKIGYTI